VIGGTLNARSAIMSTSPNETCAEIGDKRIVMSVQDFQALLARARQGNQEAMKRLIEEYEPEVLRFARRRLGRALRVRLGSHDLVQSVHRTLIRCLRQNRFTFAGPKDLVALAVDIVKKKVARQAARHRREKEILSLRERLLRRANPERAAKLATEVQDLLETLKDDDRRIVQLKLEGYTTAKIAGELGLKPGPLRSRWGRLRVKLRAAGVDIA
jgi:RNA polymerase sigma factor (sigma-70 family)